MCIFFGEVSIPILCLPLNWVCLFFTVELFSASSIHKILIRCNDLQIFSPISWAVFSLSWLYQFWHRRFWFWWNPIHPLFLWLRVLLVIISEKTLPNSRSQRFTSILFPKTFTALPFPFRSSIYFELLFTCAASERSKYKSLTYRYLVGPAPFVEKTIFSLLNGLGSFIKKTSTDHRYRGFLWMFVSSPLICMSNLTPVQTILITLTL